MIFGQVLINFAKSPKVFIIIVFIIVFINKLTNFDSVYTKINNFFEIINKIKKCWTALY